MFGEMVAHEHDQTRVFPGSEARGVGAFLGDEVAALGGQLFVDVDLDDVADHPGLRRARGSPRRSREALFDVVADRDRFGARERREFVFRGFERVLERDVVRSRRTREQTTRITSTPIRRSWSRVVSARSALAFAAGSPSLSRARPPSGRSGRSSRVGRDLGAAAFGLDHRAPARTPLDVKRRRTSGVDFASPTVPASDTLPRGRGTSRRHASQSDGGWDSRGVVDEDFASGSLSAAAPSSSRRRNASVMFSSILALGQQRDRQTIRAPTPRSIAPRPPRGDGCGRLERTVGRVGRRGHGGAE